MEDFIVDNEDEDEEEETESRARKRSSAPSPWLNSSSPNLSRTPRSARIRQQQPASNCTNHPTSHFDPDCYLEKTLIPARRLSLTDKEGAVSIDCPEIAFH